MQRIKDVLTIAGFVLIFSLIWVGYGTIDGRGNSNIFARAIRFLIWLAVVGGLIYGGIFLVKLLLHIVSQIIPWLMKPM